MRQFKAIFVVFIFVSGSGLSQTGIPEGVRVPTQDAVSGSNAEPVLFTDVSINTYQMLSANAQFSKDDNLQKVLFAPFKLMNNYIDVLSETKLNLAQKDGISTFGLAIAYDQASPFGRRGNRKFMDIKEYKKLSEQQFKEIVYGRKKLDSSVSEEFGATQVYDSTLWTFKEAFYIL